MVGKNVFDFTYEEGKALGRRNLEKRKLGVEDRVVFKCIRKDGSPVWLLFCANPIFDRGGRFAGALAMVANFSKHKDAEVRMAAQVEELKRRLILAEGELGAEKRRQRLSEPARDQGRVDCSVN